VDRFSYNGTGEVALNPEKPTSPDPAGPPDNVPENPELEDFFQRLPANFRWPKPSPEAVAAAVEAIQRISGASGAGVAMEPGADPQCLCATCGQPLTPGLRFCTTCGAAINQDAVETVRPHPSPAGGQHHYHHHYHHFVSAPAAAAPVPAAEAAPSVHGKAPTAAGTSPPGRAEIAARQVVQDWAQACNTKHLDDLLELYASDATVIRSSLPPVRSLPAIREFLFSLLEAGLGDVEMESLRTDVMGEVATDLGRCKMLVPVAMGKRREERGKYLVVLVRQPSGIWKIFADCWSSDQVVSGPQPDAARKTGEPASARKIR
jgi:ketosteroid isomerase-like protein